MSKIVKKCSGGNSYSEFDFGRYYKYGYQSVKSTGCRYQLWGFKINSGHNIYFQLKIFTHEFCSIRMNCKSNYFDFSEILHIPIIASGIILLFMLVVIISVLE
jgi:hypothetical protein